VRTPQTTRLFPLFNHHDSLPTIFAKRVYNVDITLKSQKSSPRIIKK